MDILPNDGSERTSELAKADTSDFIAFGTFCKGLPHIKPRLSRKLLDAWFENAFAAEDGAKFETAPGVFVTHQELDELDHENDWGNRVISPAGGALLVRLYLAGALETGNKKPGVPSSVVLKYIASEQALREAATARREEARRYQEALHHLERISESEFTYRLLDDLFFANNGPGEGELLIGGVTVHKSLCGYSSNSGKSNDWAVRYRWTSSDGSVKTLNKESCYANNRRNDEDRNWGLHE